MAPPILMVASVWKRIVTVLVAPGCVDDVLYAATAQKRAGTRLFIRAGVMIDGEDQVVTGKADTKHVELAHIVPRSGVRSGA